MAARAIGLGTDVETSSSPNGAALTDENEHQRVTETARHRLGPPRWSFACMVVALPRPIAWAVLGLPRCGGRTRTLSGERRYDVVRTVRQGRRIFRTVPTGRRLEARRVGPMTAQAIGLGNVAHINT